MARDDEGSLSTDVFDAKEEANVDCNGGTEEALGVNATKDLLKEATGDEAKD